ncbi:MAG TPA: hypothetical protein VIS74_03335 [Chthoniobacterales bacterium]
MPGCATAPATSFMINKFTAPLRPLLVLGILTLGWMPSGFGRAPVIGMPAKDLLASLPAAPAQWEMKESWAKNDFSDWLTTIAQREFAGPVPLDPTTKLPAPKLRPTVRFRITDTGYWPIRIFRYQNFEPGTSEGVERKLLKDSPAFVVAKSDESGTSIRISLLLRERFLVELTTKNLEMKDAEAQLDRVGFGKLRAVPANGETKLPQPMTLTCIDEMHPQRTRTYQTFHMSLEEMEKARSIPPR